jgi:TolB protein
MLPLWALACGGGPPDTVGTLLLVSDRPEPTTWALSADGSGARRIGAALEGGVFPGPPDPQGTHALLITAADGEQGHVERMWLAPLDGGPAVALIPPTRIVRNPAWTPDGAAVVFESDAQSFRDLYRVARGGGAPVRLTDQPNGSFEPDVSRSGQIAFGTSRDGNAEVYVMQADGSQPVRRTEDPGDDVKPRWSPDGSALAWIAHRKGTARVWVSGADGARPLRSQSTGNDLDYAWSADGRRLAVVVQEGPKQGALQVVEVADGRVVGVLDGPGVDEHPAWAPDGAWIAYTAGEGETSQVVLATPDGEHRRTVSAGGSAEWLPRWVHIVRP